MRSVGRANFFHCKIVFSLNLSECQLSHDDERFSDPTLSDYSADYYKQVCGCRRDILTYEIELADAISHLTLICGFKSVKRLIFTHFVMGMLYTKTYINFTRRPSICNELQM